MLADYDFSNIVKEIVRKEDIQEPFQLIYENATNKGDGYLGIINAYQIKGSNKKLDLIFKYTSRSVKLHETMPLSNLFKIEINFYEAAPQMIQFQRDFCIEDVFDNIPKCYATVAEPVRDELLALENLRVSGYQMWDRKSLMNQVHLELILATFAKFHGVSLAMKALKPELFTHLARTYFDNARMLEEAFEKMGAGSFKSVCQSLWDIFDDGDPNEKDIREAFVNFTEDIENVVQYDKIVNENSVIRQGDCWCNNMMFKYEDSDDKDRPTGIKLLDFQCCRIGSPIIDLSYCFYASAPKEALDNLDHYLSFYHNELKKYLSQYKCDVEKIYPYKRFLDDWQKLGTFGLSMAPLVKKVMLCDADEAPDFAKTADDGTEQSAIESLTFKCRREDEFRKQMKDLVVHFYQRKMI